MLRSLNLMYFHFQKLILIRELNAYENYDFVDYAQSETIY